MLCEVILVDKKMPQTCCRDSLLSFGSVASVPVNQSWRTWWRHQMETFSALLALCEGTPLVACGFPSQRPVTRSFDVFLICASTNNWVNNRDVGNLGRHRDHHDVTLMIWANDTYGFAKKLNIAKSKRNQNKSLYMLWCLLLPWHSQGFLRWFYFRLFFIVS